MAAATSSTESKTVEGGVEENPIPLHENVLQKHAAFFDTNHDGVIYPWETYKGLREIGVGMLLSTGTALFINVALSQSTRPPYGPNLFMIEALNDWTQQGQGFLRRDKRGKFPSLLLPIEVKNIQLGKHGSDTGVYDKEGRFVPTKFEEIFTKHAHTSPNALTYDELKEMLKANREPKDLKGRIGAFVEWNLFYKLAKDKNGLLEKETIRGIYDGSVFEILKEKHSSGKKK